MTERAANRVWAEMTDLRERAARMDERAAKVPSDPNGRKLGEVRRAIASHYRQLADLWERVLEYDPIEEGEER